MVSKAPPNVTCIVQNFNIYQRQQFNIIVHYVQHFSFKLATSCGFMNFLSQKLKRVSLIYRGLTCDAHPAACGPSHPDRLKADFSCQVLKTYQWYIEHRRSDHLLLILNTKRCIIFFHFIINHLNTMVNIIWYVHKYSRNIPLQTVDFQKKEYTCCFSSKKFVVHHRSFAPVITFKSEESPKSIHLNIIDDVFHIITRKMKSYGLSFNSTALIAPRMYSYDVRTIVIGIFTTWNSVFQT